MFYYLDIENQIKRVIKNADLLNSPLPVSNQDRIVDIYDGTKYKSILNSSIGNSILKKEAFTFLMNSDGISICEKSNLTIWPVFLVINEIEIQKRFCIDNIILAGKYLFFSLFLNKLYFFHFLFIFYFLKAISAGPAKPDFNIFFKPLIINLRKLELGIKLKLDNNLEKEFKFFTISSVFDKPAKAAILNIISSNGFNGCHMCLQPGQTFHTEKGKKFTYENL